MLIGKVGHSLLIALVWLSLSNAVWARDNNVTVYEVRQGDAIHVMAKLDKCSEATITVTATLNNMESSAPVPLTAEVSGDKPKLLVVFTPRDTGAQWNYAWASYWKHGHRLGVTPANFVYAFPFNAGLHSVIQGPHGDFSHYAGSQDDEAIDWAMPVGTTVCAARSGIVVATRADCSVGAPDTRLISEYNYIMIKHDDGTYAEYVHLQKNGVLVHVGDRVSLRQPIAVSGNTGYTNTPHLHFAVFYPIDGYTRTTLPVSFNPN